MHVGWQGNEVLRRPQDIEDVGRVSRLTPEKMMDTDAHTIWLRQRKVESDETRTKVQGDEMNSRTGG